jgi:hypothetical protein
MSVSDARTKPGTWTGHGLPLADLWFRELFDDAALFPPRRALPVEAVTEHREWMGAEHANLVGPLVTSDVRWPAVRDLLEPQDSFSLSLVLTRGMTSLAGLRSDLAGVAVSLRQVEVPVSTSDEITELLHEWVNVGTGGAHLYVEVPLALVTPRVCQQLTEAGARLKMRTGGLVADAFPSELELARALVVGVEAGVAFKLTAGLHHAIRYRDMTTGFEHHGFLNVLLATSAALRHSDISGVATMLGLEHPSTIISALLSLDADLVRQVRGLFTSFGTCSIEDPVDDLAGLSLIPRTP